MEKNEERGIVPWFARNHVAANLLMIAILITGILSALSIKKEFFPEIDLQTIIVRVPYLGAAPVEVEDGVCIKIEESIQDLEGIELITSTASEGIATIEIELEPDYQVSELLDQIKFRIDAITTLPVETEKPIIYERTRKREVIWVHLYGDADEKTLKEFAKKTRDEMLRLPEITQVDIRGAREYEISIEISEESLRKYNLTFDEIVRAVRRSSIDLPGGSLKTSGGEILLRSKGQAYRGHEFEKIPLRTEEDGTRILLGQIANVVDGFEDRENISRFNGKPAVGLQVFRVGNQSALDVSAAIKKFVAEKSITLPQGLQISAWADRSRLLKDRLNLMLKNALFGGMLVFLLLTIFLRFKLAFWVMMGIPVSFLGTLIIMPTSFFDISINMITLFGFILVLGIVVDDAIVIGENVYTTVKRDGQSVNNVIKGTMEVVVPALFGVLTTVVAFTPMLMIPGVQGAIWSGIALVVILCLLFSIVESKLILPAHLANIKTSESKNILTRIQSRVADGLEYFIHTFYKPTLAVTLNYRYITIAFFIALVILSVGLILGGIVRWVHFPDVETDYPRVSLSMLEGTPVNITKKAVKKIETALVKTDAQFKKEFSLEKGALLQYSTYNTSDTEAQFAVELSPGESRPFGTKQFVNRWRENVGQIPGSSSMNFSGVIRHRSTAIDFQLDGNNYEQLDRAADELKLILASYPGVYDIKDSFKAGKKEIQLKPKPEAEAFGISYEKLARQVRQAFYGAQAQRIQRGKDEIKVMVRFPPEHRNSISSLEGMRIRTDDGIEVPFETVADMEFKRGYSTIIRKDFKRVVNVTAKVNKSTTEPQTVITSIINSSLPELKSKYPDTLYSLEGESRDQQESMASLRQNSILALILIYALMAIPLKSYSKPLIIMSVIPFGVVGAILGHWIMSAIANDMPISILSLCGIIALAGVVVNDSLVMVDFINKNEAKGQPKMDAVREAGAARFRAILLTSLTTFFGLVPILMEKSLQAKFLIPMATSLAFGILFATAITLFLIPSLYLILEDTKTFWKWLWKKE